MNGTAPGMLHALELSAVHLTTVFRSVATIPHPVVSHHRGDSQSIIGKHAAAAHCLGFSMSLQISPGTDSLFIMPERERKVFPLCGQALEALDGYEAINFQQIFPQGS